MLLKSSQNLPDDSSTYQPIEDAERRNGCGMLSALVSLLSNLFGITVRAVELDGHYLTFAKRYRTKSVSLARVTSPQSCAKEAPDPFVDLRIAVGNCCRGIEWVTCPRTVRTIVRRQPSSSLVQLRLLPFLLKWS